jgi:uncharacterized membrane protein YqaE (UPF0057 family)
MSFASGVRAGFSYFVLFLLSCICPPAVAYILTKKKDLTLSIVLTLLGGIPGVLRKALPSASFSQEDDPTPQ